MNNEVIDEGVSRENFSITRVRRSIFIIATIIASVLVIELATFLLFLVAGDGISGYRRIQNERIAAMDSSVAPMPELSASEFATHPYLGYVINRDLTPMKGSEPLSYFGFWDTGTPIRKESPDTMFIALFGGSLARWFSDDGSDELIRSLRADIRFTGKEIELISMAMGGYKQPQQMLAFNYLLSLGAHFDMVINLDGFNEIVLPSVENRPKGVNPFFPRSWYRQVEALPDRRVLHCMGNVEFLRNIRREWAEVCHRIPFRYSPSITVLWHRVDHFFLAKLHDHEMEILSHRSDSGNQKSFEATGPPFHFTFGGSFEKNLARIWRNCSLQMHQMCEAHNIRYWHFLQPNQYVPGSKPLSKDERKIAYNPNHPYKRHVERGYPHLRTMGGEMTGRGVCFHDMTDIYASEKRPVYRDDCCHLNDLGNALLARQMARLIIEDLSRE